MSSVRSRSLQQAFEQPLITLTLLLVALATVLGLLGFSSLPSTHVGAATRALAASGASAPYQLSLSGQEGLAPKLASAYAPSAPSAPSAPASSQGMGQEGMGQATQSRIVFARGHTQQRVNGRTWLVYGFANGWWRATTNFYVNSKHQMVSRVPGFVPSWLGPYKHHASASHSVTQGSGSVSGVRSVSTIAFARGQILRGDNAGGVSDGYRAGQCTEGAFMLAAHTMRGMGNGGDWDNTARARHLPVGYSPRVGATVVFERGVAGASRTYGHVAHVVAVSGSRFLIKEMNGTAGPFRFDLRWVTMARGISFIYW